MSKGKTKVYNFRFDDELIAKIDAWREQQEIEPTRTDVIKLALERFFGSTGQVKSKRRPERGTE
jgi:hypothetical protein